MLSKEMVCQKKDSTQNRINEVSNSEYLSTQDLSEMSY